jgi:hypothetical protein
MQGFITHCGAAEVTREEAFAVPVPEHTRTYKPVSYQTLTETVERLLTTMGLQTIDSAYALNRKGRHFFAKYVCDTGDVDATMGLSIVFRQSYDKTFSLAIAMGANTFCCDNLALTGDFFRVLHKNTLNGWDNFRRTLAGEAFTSEPLAPYYQLRDISRRWSDVDLSEVEGYRILGELVGKKLLRPHQAIVAFNDWRTPRHAQFTERHYWNLYQDITEGLKKGPAASMAERHIEIHRYMQDRLLGESTLGSDLQPLVIEASGCNAMTT